MCTKCVQDWIKRIVDDQSTRITCPQCQVELDYFDVKEAADKDTFQRYETQVLTGILGEDSTFKWCAHACGSGQLHPAPDYEPIMTCYNCGKKTCVVHQAQWHSGATCKQFDQMMAQGERAGKPGQTQRKEIASLRSQQQELEEQELEAALDAMIQREKDNEASREVVRRTSKQCPKCNFDIEKAHGCDRMTCTHCRHAFCWVCLTDYAAIAMVGNSAHTTTCVHWRAWASPDEGLGLYVNR